MENEERDLLVRRQILNVLDQCGGYLVPEQTLFTQVNITAVPAVIQLEFRNALNFLDGQGYIGGVRPALGGPIKWRITDKGRSVLANA